MSNGQELYVDILETTKQQLLVDYIVEILRTITGHSRFKTGQPLHDIVNIIRNQLNLNVKSVALKIMVHTIMYSAVYLQHDPKKK